MDYSIKELMEWNEKIEKIASDFGLDYYEQEFEIVSYEEMLSYEAYIGMPSRYPHWSFGKSYERNKTLYKYNLTGLPYEMVINSNPCLGYLMKENTLLLQILTMAHVYGHNDFFKNNRLFKEGTKANYTIEMFKRHADLIRDYIKNPYIGLEEVEKIIDAAHALKLQVSRTISKVQENEKQNEKYNLPEEDLLLFIIKYSDIDDYKKTIVEMIREEALYFIPQIETKIMNEGWASYWHYKILNKLELPQNLHLEFIKRHNDVVSPRLGGLNPYYVGFKMFEDLEKRYGTKKIFEVREVERDYSFIRRYLTLELCQDMNLFEYAKRDSDYIVKEVSDEEGWKEIRDTLSNNCGMGMVPYIHVVDVERDRTLVLEHVYDGRELLLEYAESTLKHMVDLWGHPVILKTMMAGKEFTILCDDKKSIKRGI